MFSNQYLGTRSIAKGVPRVSSALAFSTPGPYTRMARYDGNPMPINRQGGYSEDNDEVDYSFNQLPVHERRKMFIRGGTAPALRPAGLQSMTLPRQRFPAPASRTRHETQSEYSGDDPFGWEAPITPRWNQRQQATPTPACAPTYSSSTTGQITLNTTSHVSRPTYQKPYAQQRIHRSPQQQQTMFQSQQSYPHGVCRLISPTQVTQDQSPKSVRYLSAQPEAYQTFTYPIQSSVTVPAYEPNWNDGYTRIVPNANTRVYSPKRYTSIVSSSRIPESVVEQWKPLSVKVYNSECSRTAHSPHQKMETSWGSTSPVYPAYPAHISRPYDPDRYHRGTSVQPVTMQVRQVSPVRYPMQVEQSWKPLQVSATWDPSRSSRRQGRYISAPKSPSIRQRPQSSDEPGVSDF